MELFYPKILLFGEYSVLQGSPALTIPYRGFSATLEFLLPSQKNDLAESSNRELAGFYHFLESDLPGIREEFDLSSFRKDLKNGLYLHSDIPQNYGLGSSGAVIASLFNRYAFTSFKKKTLAELKTRFAQVESYFHGSSSGVDPLSIFVNRPLLFKGAEVSPLNVENIRSTLTNFFLLDTGKASKTGGLVPHYLKMSKEAKFIGMMKADYVPAVESVIDSISSNLSAKVPADIRTISALQLTHFDKMIPDGFKSLWQEGLDSGEFFLKLCGSGGGGFLLLYAFNPEVLSSAVLNKDLSPLRLFPA